jgi:hypothetical protein
LDVQEGVLQTEELELLRRHGDGDGVRDGSSAGDDAGCKCQETMVKRGTVANCDQECSSKEGQRSTEYVEDINSGGVLEISIDASGVRTCPRCTE